MPTPRYKIRPDTGDLQEYLFEYNGILALKNFVARVDGERLILHSGADMNFSILDALVSEVEIDGRVYDNAEAAQEALMRLTFNTNRPVIMTQQERELLQGALQRGTYVGTAADLKALIDGKVDKEAGKGLSTNDFTNAYKQKLDTLEDYDIELDEATTEFKLKKGNNVVRRISLMFLDDEGTKLLYNRTAKTLELRDKRDNLLTSIPVSHFVSNIPTSIVVQNGKIKLMAGNTVIDQNTISYNDLADKPSMDFIPTSWNRRDNKEVIRTQVDEWLRINELNSHSNGVYFGTSVIRTDGQVQVGEDGAEAVLSNQGLILKKRLRINGWAGGDGADIKCKGNLQIGSTSGIVEFRKIFGDLVNWNGNATITVDINDGVIKLNGIKTNVNPSAEKVFATNGQTIHLAEYIGTSGSISSNWTMTDAWYGRTINVMANAAVNISTMAENRNVTFRKCFAGGAVTFNTTGKQVVYTGDNTFNGGDGSTAVVSTAGGNKMYIDIRNI
jgi:hypothetical protein